MSLKALFVALALTLGCVVHPGQRGAPLWRDASITGAVEPLPEALRQRMTGSSIRPGCPVPLEELVLVRVQHWGFDGVVQEGKLVVARSVGEEVHALFQELFERRFPIQQVRPVDDFGGDDDKSMAANNTSAFNCRFKTGQSTYSRHSYGTAVDINPVQNPFVKGGEVFPTEGRAYLNRDAATKGLIVSPGPVTDAFGGKGWTWGGSWTTRKDYQHFEKP